MRHTVAQPLKPLPGSPKRIALRFLSVSCWQAAPPSVSSSFGRELSYGGWIEAREMEPYPTMPTHFGSRIQSNTLAHLGGLPALRTCFECVHQVRKCGSFVGKKQ